MLSTSGGLGELAMGVAQGAKSSNRVGVDIGGNVTTVDVARDLTVAAGDVVLVAKVGGRWLAVARYWGSAPTSPDQTSNPTPPKPAPVTATGTLVVTPVETRSYRGTYGWRSDNADVYQGEYGSWGNHTGCAFYGTKPRSLSGATVVAASVRVKRLAAGAYAAQTATLRLVTQATRPAGAPTLTSSSTGPRLAVGATDSSFDVPTSWAQSIVDGTAGGLAIHDADGSPYIRLAGRGSWSPAWTLSIQWRR